MADSDVGEQVRARYAAAATTAGRDALAVVKADQCCVPAAGAGEAEAIGSSCGCGTEVTAASNCRRSPGAD